MKSSPAYKWTLGVSLTLLAALTGLIASTQVSLPNAPKDKNGSKYVLFQEVFQKKVIQNEQWAMDSIATRGKISANVVAQYKNGDSTMAALVGQAHMKLKKIQARNDSIRASYAKIAKARADSAKLAMAKQRMKPKPAAVSKQVRTPVKQLKH